MRPIDIHLCVQLFHDGIHKYHQLPLDELPELVESLERREDYISDELGFEFIAGQLKVSLHDREAWCDPKEFLDAIGNQTG
ncbi:hypothetical protein [Haliangium ochraceum]|uniref:Uncharacterized protein n=1 Tax=Haliangium ochraceum (strain DSM 14365 / JCM 11303 / SMP-2) TaxID=502025 RepID=D0LPG7_HALO1|nr:hypothetical protein [Haliangium ochraceum]ACY13532.1 hypothetical protein Hoch_0924 [Haliangium ochraceum DSM 14365]